MVELYLTRCYTMYEAFEKPRSCVLVNVTRRRPSKLQCRLATVIRDETQRNSEMSISQDDTRHRSNELSVETVPRVHTEYLETVFHGHKTIWRFR